MCLPSLKYNGTKGQKPLRLKHASTVLMFDT